MGSVAAVVLLGTGRIDLRLAMLFEGGASSGQLIPREEECPWEHLCDVLREKLYLVSPVICLREFSMR